MAKSSNKSVEVYEHSKLEEGKEIVEVELKHSAIMIGGQQFQAIERVTIPTLSHKYPDVLDVAVEFLSEFQDNESIDETTKVSRIVKVAKVIDLTTGEVSNYVGSAVIVSELKSFAPNGYIGRKFAIRKLKPPLGKRYNKVSIMEIE